MRTVVLMSVLLYCNCTFCQKIDLATLDRTIKKGFCSGEAEKCKRSQIEYLNACGSMGDHYFKLKEYRLALKYYMLAANIGVYTDGELQDDKVIALRNIISAKAGDIHFFGHGIAKDKLKAFYLHNKVPTFYTASVRDKYSALYFGDKKYFYIFASDNNQNFAVNPFYFNDTASYPYFQTCLKNIEQKMQKNSGLNCKVELTYGLLKLNTINQGYLNRVLDSFRQYISETYKTRFSFELIPSEKGHLYRSLILPELSVTLTDENK